ncbi:spore germination protein [Clostridium sp. 'White wine YQ']|uniref:spore germination protein n=1 Tax=Clostridium sp. 'White wine YQ' TaxID=3027474 RepID=UPI0023652D96|nr:spore germination protein [Clostridium sp. 'White wine YQ']MDD7794965.1 spore germination protein [Clostridium sp. 'White wine YQ']
MSKNNLDIIKEKFNNAFDVKYREIETPIGKATLVFIDDLCSSDFISQYIIKPLIAKRNNISNTEDLLTKVLDINLAGDVKDISDAELHILMGDVVLIFSQNEKMLYCEVKGFVRRSVGIPVTESVLKGPREGFAEALVDNVALIRRRIKNPSLKFEVMFAGTESQTTICVCYMDGIAPSNLVEEVKRKVKKIKYNFILDTNYIENELKEKKSVFDTVGYTEKPDEVCSKIMEGRVSVIVDGTPFVITVPYFFLENFQAPDDYYLNKYFVNFTRCLRWIAFFISTFLPGIYVAIITYHYGMIPTLFVFRLAVARAGVPFPTFLEVILMMVFFQLIKEAGLRLPQPIGGAMSIVSALILGDAAVGAGLASRTTILVVAISTVSYFLIPKVYGAVSIWSIIIVILSAAYGLIGFTIGEMVLIAHLASLKTTGYSYLFPLGTTKSHEFKDIIFRGDLRKISGRIFSKGE